MITFIPTCHHFDVPVKYCDPQETRFLRQNENRNSVEVIISVISTVLGIERNTKGEETVSEFKLKFKLR